MKIKTHEGFEVYKEGFEAAMQIFEISKGFPIEERYSLTDQMRRSSISVCADIAEAFRRRRYPGYLAEKHYHAQRPANKGNAESTKEM